MRTIIIFVVAVFLFALGSARPAPAVPEASALQTEEAQIGSDADIPSREVLPSPLLPWLEANQGLLSLLALCAALAVAVYENGRANKADRRSDERVLRREVAAFVGLLNIAVGMGDIAKQLVAEGVDVPEVCARVTKMKSRLRNAFAASGGPRAHTPLMAVYIQQVVDTFDEASFAKSDETALMGSVLQFTEHCSGHIESFAGLLKHE